MLSYYKCGPISSRFPLWGHERSPSFSDSQPASGLVSFSFHSSLNNFFTSHPSSLVLPSSDDPHLSLPPPPSPLPLRSLFASFRSLFFLHLWAFFFLFSFGVVICFSSPPAPLPRAATYSVWLRSENNL